MDRERMNNMPTDELKLPNKVRYNKHPRRKNNDRVAAMYAMYASGKSLADVGEAYGVTRQSMYQVFYRRGYEMRSKPKRFLTIVDGIPWTWHDKGGMRGTLPDGRRVLLHHYIWEKANGPVPKGFSIVFVNGNKRDVRIENLHMLSVAEVSSIMSPHLNQFTSPTGSRIVRRSRWADGEHRYFRPKTTV